MAAEIQTAFLEKRSFLNVQVEKQEISEKNQLNNFRQDSGR